MTATLIAMALGLVVRLHLVTHHTADSSAVHLAYAAVDPGR